MTRLVVTARARAQLASLPDVAARAVDEALRRLPYTPFIGVELLDNLGDVFYRKLVIVRRRRWSLHITYRIRGNDLIVEYIDPAWVRRSSI